MKLSTFSFPRFSGLDHPQMNPGPTSLDVLSKEGNPFPIDSLPELGIAIVGTRYPQKRSLDLMEKTIRDLRGTDLIIVSGFARGVDSRAHDLAIENGLRTIAILGCGIDVHYPIENRSLRQKIIDRGGWIVSEFQNDFPPYPGNFLLRNRLIACFAKALWVVEGGSVSGTLNTAQWASRLDRDLFATAHFPGDPHFQGNQKLLSQLHPDRHPFAYPLFSAQTFQTTWPELKFNTGDALPNKRSGKSFPRSSIETWVAAIQAERGNCTISNVAERAIENGWSIPDFYQKLDDSFQNKTIIQGADGSLNRVPDS